MVILSFPCVVVVSCAYAHVPAHVQGGHYDRNRQVTVSWNTFLVESLLLMNCDMLILIFSCFRLSVSVMQVIFLLDQKYSNVVWMEC